MCRAAQRLCCHTAALTHRAIDAIVHAVDSGKLSRATLDMATRRFDALRSRYARPVGVSQLRSSEHLAVVERILKGGLPSCPKWASIPPK